MTRSERKSRQKRKPKAVAEKACSQWAGYLPRIKDEQELSLGMLDMSQTYL
jgi:hypothetical protein